MSLMCKMNEQCTVKKGLCIHEKVMLSAMTLAFTAAIAHWVLRLF